MAGWGVTSPSRTPPLYLFLGALLSSIAARSRLEAALTHHGGQGLHAPLTISSVLLLRW